MENDLFAKAFDRLCHIKRKQGKGRPMKILVSGGIGFLLGVSLVVLDGTVAEMDLFGVSFLSAILLTMLLQLISHELGHWLFGLLSGYRFISFRIFSFAFYKRKGKLTFGRYNVPGTAGQCLMYPPTEKDGVIPYRLFNLGGVIVNLVLTAASLVPAILWYDTLPRFWFFFLAGMAFWGLVLALGNGIPHKSATVSNDGYNAKALGKDPAALKVFANQLRINAAMTDGLRLGEMPEEWFLVEKSDAPASSMISSMRMMAANRLLDLGDLRGAEEALVFLVAEEESLPDFYVYTAMSELLYLEMVGAHRQEVVNALYFELEPFFRMTRNSFTTLRVETVYHYLFTGDQQIIGKNRARFERLAARFPFTGDVLSERMLLDRAVNIYNAWQNRMTSE